MMGASLYRNNSKPTWKSVDKIELVGKDENKIKKIPETEMILLEWLLHRHLTPCKQSLL